MPDQSSSPPIPGPPARPIVGHLNAFKNAPLELFSAATQTYGDVVRFKILSREVVLLNHPDGAKHILLDNYKNYSKQTMVVKKLMVLGKGLIFSDGEEWKRQRKMLQPSFKRKCLKNFFTIMQQESAETVRIWQEKDLQAVNLSEEITHLTLRIVCRALFGSTINSYAHSPQGLGASVAYLLHAARARTLNLYNLPQSVPTPGNIQFKKHRKVLSDHISALIAKRKIDGPGEDMLSMLLFQEQENISKQELVDQVQTFLLAGHDTTSNAVQWTLYLLSQHKKIYKRCQEEARSIREINWESMQNMPNIQNAIREALRLYPPAWIIPRMSIHEDRFRNFTIPANTPVYISPYTLHRHADFWSEANHFQPQRFEQELKHPFSYLPFGAGPRICIGKEFALQETLIIISTLLRHFQISVESFEYRPKAGITLRPHRDMQATLEAHRSKRSAKAMIN